MGDDQDGLSCDTWIPTTRLPVPGGPVRTDLSVRVEGQATGGGPASDRALLGREAYPGEAQSSIESVEDETERALHFQCKAQFPAVQPPEHELQEAAGVGADGDRCSDRMA